MTKLKYLLLFLFLIGVIVYAWMVIGDKFVSKVAEDFGIEEMIEHNNDNVAKFDYQNIKIGGLGYDVVSVNPQKDKIRFFWQDKNADRYGNFKKLSESLELNGENMVFATNGSLYGTDFAPLGLYIENGEVLKNVVEGRGEGNFSIKPNGIVLIYEDRAEIIKTEDYIHNEDILYANQSGPMLVHDGMINTNFKSDSASKYIRNGVGVNSNGDLFFAISNQAVNFYDFAKLFKEELACDNALYLDGSISEMYVAGTDRQSSGLTYAVIIAVVE